MPVMDANEAVADVAYRVNEVIVIYPITPASPMGEHADAWAARRRSNLWGDVPDVVEMQSEGGAAGALHGALQGGALATTFTASQGLLLMLPNLYKIAGELTACAIHVAARTIATHALSIFGDHSDVYAARGTGFAMLASNDAQEAHDLALLSHAASLEARVPFLHFFDGFRTSHELTKVELLTDEQVGALVDPVATQAHRDRALNPERPQIRGTAQNPDAFFQSREAASPFYAALPGVVDRLFDRFEEVSGRRYHRVEYVGHPEAERVIVLMGSAVGAATETVRALVERGERVGLVAVRLFRPFPTDALRDALPPTVRRVAVLDRAKEPGAPGDPLYLDAVAALHEEPRAVPILVVGGRYGLSGKEFTPAMAKGVFDALSAPRPKNHFTVGIEDDVSGSSLSYDASFVTEPDDVVRCVFYGLGSDGTVSANKNSIKIIGDATGHHVQGYFVYDSKKSGAMTVSHLRFGPRPITSTYLVQRAGFIACHQWSFVGRVDILERATDGAVLLLDCPHPPGEVWERLPHEVQHGILDKGIQLWVIDAARVAREAGLGGRISTVMQACFFSLSGVLPAGDAMEAMRHAIESTYGKRGRVVVRRNFAAIESALEGLSRVELPAAVTADQLEVPRVPPGASDFVQRVTSVLMSGKGDALPVSAFPPDGTWPTGTAKWEKRSIALELPAWDPAVCIQCNKCAMVCPHAAIRVKAYPNTTLAGAPPQFPSTRYRGKERPDHAYTVHVAPDDCTGCRLCVEVCPARDKSTPRHKALDMAPRAADLAATRESYDFFLGIEDLPRADVALSVKDSQFFLPLFEYSGACAGCGETPYVKLLTQLFGDRIVIANATGCSSIYGGNLPTTPYTTNPSGRGPAWSNSLFEDNAEFGLGIRLAIEHQQAQARRVAEQLGGSVDAGLLRDILGADQRDERGIEAQRARIARLREALETVDDPRARHLETIAEHLVRRSVWIVGGDGWAYDIGYGGLDHVLASGKDVNLLVLDTEVYSNTGGQQSKATPLGASAKFAVNGKPEPKKDLGLLAMSYGNVYVAQVALGAKDRQTLDAFVEAERHPGPSLIIAYSHCIAHGYDLAHGLSQQQLAVQTGYWPLYRFDPKNRTKERSGLRLDSGAPDKPLREFREQETRFRVLAQIDPERGRALSESAQRHVDERYETYKRLAGAAPEDS